jgi:hypothetical protein
MNRAAARCTARKIIRRSSFALKLVQEEYHPPELNTAAVFAGRISQIHGHNFDSLG